MKPNMSPAQAILIGAALISVSTIAARAIAPYQVVAAESLVRANTITGAVRYRALGGSGLSPEDRVCVNLDMEAEPL